MIMLSRIPEIMLTMVSSSPHYSSLTYLLTYILTHPLTYSLIRSLTYSFTGDIELGSIDDFKNLGRNARIRLIGDKIDDDGRRVLCLEVLSDSISPQNPFKRWVIYEEAMILLGPSLARTRSLLLTHLLTHLLGVITETENLNNNEDNTNDDNDKDIFSYYSQVSQM